MHYQIIDATRAAARSNEANVQVSSPILTMLKKNKNTLPVHPKDPCCGCEWVMVIGSMGDRQGLGAG